MAIPTFLVGVLPGYQVLGMMAPVVLTLLRMVQGLSVGGEYTTSIVFMVEHAPPGRRGADRRHGLLRRGRRHPARLGDRRAAERDPAGGGHAGLGLAHSVPARPGGRAGRLLPAPASRRGRGAAGRPAVRRSRRRCATWLAAGAAGRPVGVQRGQLLPAVRLHRELAAARRRHRAGACAGDQLAQHAGAAALHDRDGRLSDRLGRKPMLLAARRSPSCRRAAVLADASATSGSLSTRQLGFSSVRPSRP